MARKTKSKCVVCKESFATEDMIIKSNKKYCLECSKIVVVKEKSDWDYLFKYICEIYNIKVPTGMMFMQRKKFKGDGYNYTDIGMYYTLKYYYGTLENKVKEDTGIGIIPYFYDRAKAHFNKIFDIEELAESTTISDKTVRINTKLVTKAVKKITPLSLDIVRKEDENEDND